LPRTELAFIRPLTTFLEKLDATLQRKFSALIKSKCLPVLFYGTEACPITSADAFTRIHHEQSIVQNI